MPFAQRRKAGRARPLRRLLLEPLEVCVLSPGEMLFIPAFCWHQVSALETGISLNMFYGDRGDHTFLDKLSRPPFQEHFHYWFLNILYRPFFPFNCSK